MTAQSAMHIESKGIAPVTVAESHGKPRAVFGLWMAANIEFATLTTGALATGVFGLSAVDAFISILVANLIGGVLLAVFSTFGVEYGLPQMVQGAAWFGRYGSKVPALFNFFGGFSWFAVNTIIGAYAMQYFFGASLILSVLILSLVQVAIAFIGHDMIQAAEKFFVYALVLLFAILTVVAVNHLGISVPANAKEMAEVGGLSGAFIVTTSIMVGYVVSWVPYSSDYTRYMRGVGDPAQTKRSVASYAFWGTIISTVWMECLGALIGASVSFSKPSDLFTDWMPGWFRAPLLIAIIIGTISANILNIYSATLSALALGVKLKQYQASIITGLIGTVISVLAAANFISSYTNFLFLLGYWIMPWSMVGLLSHYTTRVSRLGTVSAGFVAWVATIVLCVPFYNQAIYVGPLAAKFPQLGDITFVVSFFLAGIIYMLLSKPAYITAAVAAE